MAHAIQITGATLSNFLINAETLTTVGNSTGTFINFTLDGSADVTVLIQNTVSSQTVATLSQNYSAPAGGSYQIFWNGLWPIGDTLGRQDGSYTFQITATTGTNTSSVTINQPPLRITSVDIHNLNVVPSFDTNNNTSFPFFISYALAKEANATVSIKNSTGTVVRTLINNKLQVGETISTTTVAWDGLDKSGHTVSLGLYTVSIDATDVSTGDKATTISKNLVIQSLAGSATDAQKIFEDNVYVYPNPVRNGQATFNAVPVRDGATIHLKIYTIAGDLVLDQDITSQLPFPWKVTNQAGNKVGRGLYYYVVKEIDSQGTLQTVKKMAVLP